MFNDLRLTCCNLDCFSLFSHFQKRVIFSTIGSNLTLKDKKLLIQRLHPYMLIENELRQQRELYDALEPTKAGYEQRREALFRASIPSWLGVWDDIRTIFSSLSTE